MIIIMDHNNTNVYTTMKLTKHALLIIFDYFTRV